MAGFEKPGADAMLMSGVGWRVVGAVALLAALWAAVAWAMGPVA
jgi:hypothetical protein